MDAKEYLARIEFLDFVSLLWMEYRKELEGFIIKSYGTKEKMLMHAKEANAKIKEASQERERIARQISTMGNERYRQILQMRYIEKMAIRDIAVKIHYSEDYTKKLHKAALEAFGETFCKP